jgi:hypothetical protein
MSSSPSSPNEKVFSTQLTCNSNASSSTYRSSITLSSLKHVANSFGLLLPRKKPADVEQQSEPELDVEDDDDDDDDASIFPAGGPGPYPTKVRTR